MCNKPLYRLVVNEVVRKYLSPRLLRRMKGDGIIMSFKEFETLVNVYSIPQNMFQTIPCGHCLGCKVDYQAQWTTRAMLEASLYKENYFVTLTYNDENLPVKPLLNPETGEYQEVGCLVKEHFSAFFKRLRSRLEDKGFDSPRFLACGEYGDLGKRPHFHFLGFNFHVPDLTYYYSRTRAGDVHFEWRATSTPYYLSEMVANAWGKGFILITPLTLENCAYVCSYVNKQVTPSELRSYKDDEELKSKFKRQFYSYSHTIDNAIKLGEIPSPFLHMSRRRGLGYEKHKDIWYDYWAYNKLPLLNGKALPKRTLRYFDNIYKQRDLEFMLDNLKERRRKLYYKEYLQWSDFGQRERDLKEESLLKKQQRKKPRDL